MPHDEFNTHLYSSYYLFLILFYLKFTDYSPNSYCYNHHMSIKSLIINYEVFFFYNFLKFITFFLIFLLFIMLS